jgi:hypothetical protein
MMVTWVDQTVTCYRAEWRTREVPYVTYQVFTRVVETPVTYTVPQAQWSDKKVMQTFYTMRPREVVQNVTCFKQVPTTCVDPCTGCCYTTWQCVPVVQQVRSIVYDCIPAQREVTVRVCTYVPVEKKGVRRDVVCETKPVNGVRLERYCVMVPYQTTVKVPVCVPCPAPPPCGH